jgi:peptide/nickel transport system substrate-binding protein
MFQKPFVRTLLFLVIIASFVLSGCAQPAAPTQAPVEATQPPAAAPTQPPAAQPTAAAPSARKVATFIWTQEFDSLNPLYTNMWFVQVTFSFWNCYAWSFDEKNNPLPVLVKEMPSAENGGISADGKTIIMKLREDLVWSDGTPLTADDFIFTYDMTMSSKNAVSSTSPYDKMAKIEAPDPHTVVMTFKDPFAPWIGTLWHGILPKHILQPVFDKDGTIDKAEWNRAPTVGCGPFVFKEWQSGSFARFLANDKYWLGRPKLDEIFIRFVPDDASQVAALKNGDADMGLFIAYSDMPDLEKSGLTLLKAFSGFNEGMYFLIGKDKGNPALQDVKVRQAIAYATDREKLVKDLLGGRTQPAATLWDNTLYVDPSIKPYPYDPEKAKALLDEAGWKDTNGNGVRDKDGQELSLTYGTTTRAIRQDTQAVIQQELAAVGIKVELQNFSSDIFFQSYADGGPAATGQLDLFEYSNSPQFPDPDYYEMLCSEIPSAEKPTGVNSEFLCDPELDALFQKQTTQVDFAARQQTFYQITKLIYDKVYWLGLWQDPDWYAVSNRLLNVKISGVPPCFFNIAEWDLK